MRPRTSTLNFLLTDAELIHWCCLDPSFDRRRVRCAIRLAQWQRNLIGVLIAAFVSILGFNLTFPFLPLYIQSLGVPDPGDAAFWSGVIGSVAGVLAAIIAPVWGQMADRRASRCSCAPPRARPWASW